jgi:hypothetical protein
MLLASVMPIMLIIIMLTTGAFLAQKWADPIGIFVDEYYADLLFNKMPILLLYSPLAALREFKLCVDPAQQHNTQQQHKKHDATMATPRTITPSSTTPPTVGRWPPNLF